MYSPSQGPQIETTIHTCIHTNVHLEQDEQRCAFSHCFFWSSNDCSCFSATFCCLSDYRTLVLTSVLRPLPPCPQVRVTSPFFGPPSDYSVVKMIPSERLPPRNLHRVRVDKTQATLKWQPPYDAPNTPLVLPHLTSLWWHSVMSVMIMAAMFYWWIEHQVQSVLSWKRRFQWPLVVEWKKYSVLFIQTRIASTNWCWAQKSEAQICSFTVDFTVVWCEIGPGFL